MFLVLTSVVRAEVPTGEDSKNIGRVSLVLGKAYIKAPDNSRVEIKVGQIIRASDKITTEANGHVHIRFVDNALVSIRPESQLEILSYEFESDSPENSTIKFNLIEGVTRSISGEGAKAARTRFRMNTPIAAIGVRGTDFVVRASGETVRALVNEGSIVLAPFSDQCDVNSLGPCDTIEAVELHGQSYQMVELSSSTSLPLLTAQETTQEEFPSRMDLTTANDAALGQDTTEARAPDNEAFVEARTVSVASELEVGTAPAPEVDPFANLPDYTPAQAASQDLIAQRQLSWGRFAWKTDTLEEERITLPYDLARLEREVTVGNNEYVLFRVEEGTQLVDRGLGVIDFQLNSAQAFYYSDSGVVAMRVHGGKLAVDFEERLFETQLDLSNEATGMVNFEASGIIKKSGYFFSNSAAQRIAGSTSLDGAEAGYFFEQQLQSGGIKGLTLWDSN